jgi:hypothetical protein
VGTIEDAEAYKAGGVFAEQVDGVVFPDGHKIPANEAVNCASQSADILYSDKYDKGRFVAGVRGYYKRRARR